MTSFFRTRGTRGFSSDGPNAPRLTRRGSRAPRALARARMPARSRSTGGAVREEVDRLERDRDRDESAAGDHARRAAARRFAPQHRTRREPPPPAGPSSTSGTTRRTARRRTRPRPSPPPRCPRARPPRSRRPRPRPPPRTPRAAEGGLGRSDDDARGKTTAASHVAPSPSGRRARRRVRLRGRRVGGGSG